MNIKNIIQKSMYVIGMGLVFTVIAVPQPTLTAMTLAVVGTACLVLAAEVE